MKFPNPLGSLTDLFVKNVAQKFLSSLLKGLAALVIAVVAEIAKLDPVSILHANHVSLPDSTVLLVWGGFLVLLKALVSAVNRAATFDLSKLPK